MSNPRAYRRRRPELFLALLGWVAIAPGLAAWGAGETAPGERAQIVVHILDYVAVDYPGAVKDGEVAHQAEYAEQVEFVVQARGLLDQLERRPEHTALTAEADRLVALVKDKRSGPEVSALATRLRWAIIRAYGVEVAPKHPPDLRRAAALYAAQCGTCHGAEGRGDGPAGQSLEPRPANFLDLERVEQRSVYGLYSSITLGVEGTAMASFRGLSDAERWALAFYVAGLGEPEARTRHGGELWQALKDRRDFPDLASIATRSARELQDERGPDAAAILGYLRKHPDAVAAPAGATIGTAIGLLRDSVEAYRQGRVAPAQQLAASSYLDGFEPAEPSLDALDRGLRAAVETEMSRYRSLLREGAPLSAVEAQAARIEELLDRARGLLESGSLPASAAFASAFIILLREGLEALLVLAAMYALLARAGRRDALRYVHGGWIIALIAGGLTWTAASYVVAVSGATREVTEGVSALVAAAVLLYVGFWMHGKSQTRVWQAYLDRRVAGARTLWAVGFVSFLAVYREVFETVLFYEALAVQAGPGGRWPLLGGLAAAAATLVVLGWLVVRGSVRLPLGRFFEACAILLGLLAVVLAGKGIVSLQEAGWIPVHEVRFPALPLLGLYPNLQSLLLQATLVLLIVAGFAYTRHTARR